jgi:TPR repeat protein
MRAAAEMGDLRSQYYLGTFHYHGVGCPEDKALAATWFRKSAESGFAEAQLAYGLVLLSGSGVIQDKGKAIEWLGKASQQNSIRAKEIMKELLTYRGQPGSTVVLGESVAGVKSERRQADSQLRVEGKGVVLDQGDYGLKFSLPNLYDAYAPQNQMTTRSVWEKLQGATFEIVFRPLK